MLNRRKIEKIYLLPWNEFLDGDDAGIVGDVVECCKRGDLRAKELERKHGHKHVVDVAHGYQAGVPLVPAARCSRIAHQAVCSVAEKSRRDRLQQEPLLFVKIIGELG